MFDIVGNGTTLVSGFDPFTATGGQNKAVELDVTVTVTGGTGLALDLVNNVAARSVYGAFLDGIELTRAPRRHAPTANIEVSTDGGATWSTIASNVAVDRFGYGQYTWTVDRTSAGNTAEVRVTSGGVSGVVRSFLLANSGTSRTTSTTDRPRATSTPRRSATTRTPASRRTSRWPASGACCGPTR